MRKLHEDRGTGVGIEPDDEGGDEITITFGAQKYAPIQYQSFDIGPFTVRTVRRPGETFAEVYARVAPELRAMAEQEFKERLAEHLARVKLAAGAARGGTGR